MSEHSESEGGMQEGTSNDSPTHPNISSNENTTPMQTSNTVQQESENLQYWSDYKNNWINHNKPLLDKEYQEWVQSNI